MTDKDKLQKLFEAALRDTTEEPSLKQMFPTPGVRAVPSGPAPVPTADPVTISANPEPVPSSQVEPLVLPMSNAGLDEATSNELGVLLDQQNLRKKRRHRRELIVSAGVFLLMFCGGTGWFVSSADRRAAFQGAMADVRSIGDVAGMVGQYQKALDRVAERSNQIAQATADLGVTTSAKDERDPYMDTEMKQMMGGEGKTVGARSQKLQKSFGNMKAGAAVLPAAPQS